MILMQTTKLNWGRSPHFCYLCYHNAVCRCSAKLLFPCMKYKWKKDRSIITHLQISLHLPLTKLWASGLSFQLLLIRFSRLLNFLYFFFFAACLDLPPDFWLVFFPCLQSQISRHQDLSSMCYFTFWSDNGISIPFICYIFLFFFFFFFSCGKLIWCYSMSHYQIDNERGNPSWVELEIGRSAGDDVQNINHSRYFFLTVCVVSFNSRALVIKLAEESQSVHYYNLV